MRFLNFTSRRTATAAATLGLVLGLYGPTWNAASQTTAPLNTWSQFRGTANLSGISASSVPDNPKLLWSFEAGESIDFLTSAGNVSIDAVALETETPMIGGSIDPAANGVATLINAGDAIRVRSGSDEIVVPADDAMKTLVSDCRPEPEAQPEEEAEGEEGETAEEESEE